MSFPSKKGPLFRLIIWASILLFGFTYFFQEEAFGFQAKTYQSAIGFILYLLVVLLFLWLWFGTHYKLAGNELIVKSGPLKYRVKIQEIHTLKMTKSILSAPALSSDRIEIRYKQRSTLLVSPENKAEFIKALTKENPAIKVVN